jgi:hypothetical protein
VTRVTGGQFGEICGALGGLALASLGALLLLCATLVAIFNQFRPSAGRETAP